MRIRILAAVAISAAAVTSFASLAQAQVVVTVSKSQQRVAVTVDGTEMYRWPVSTGRRGYDTPVGQYRPVRLERDWYSRKYDWAPMPHSVFFYKGYAMHGTTEEKNLGRVASHGCVRLSRGNAATLFALLRERRASTRIVVTNASLPAAAPSPFMVEGDKPVQQVVAKSDTAHEAKAEAKVEAKKDEVVMPVPRPVILASVGAVSLPVIDEAAPAQVKSVEPPAKPRAPTKDVFASVGDDATVMRGREAWLRSLDRKYELKYGIVR